MQWGQHRIFFWKIHIQAGAREQLTYDLFSDLYLFRKANGIVEGRSATVHKEVQVQVSAAYEILDQPEVLFFDSDMQQSLLVLVRRVYLDIRVGQQRPDHLVLTFLKRHLKRMAIPLIGFIDVDRGDGQQQIYNFREASSARCKEWIIPVDVDSGYS